MAVRVLALALVVAEVVAGGETASTVTSYIGVCSILCGKAAQHSILFGLASVHGLRDRGVSPCPASSLRRSTCSNRWLSTPTSAAASAGQQQKQRHRAPQRAVGGQAGLKARRHQHHARGNEREEPQRGGEDVEIARHKLRWIADWVWPDAILLGWRRPISPQVRCAESLSRPVANVKHHNCLAFLQYAVDHAINTMWPMAVQDVPQPGRLARRGPEVRLLSRSRIACLSPAYHLRAAAELSASISR